MEMAKNRDPGENPVFLYKILFWFCITHFDFYDNFGMNCYIYLRKRKFSTFCEYQYSWISKVIFYISQLTQLHVPHAPLINYKKNSAANESFDD